MTAIKAELLEAFKELQTYLEGHITRQVDLAMHGYRNSVSVSERWCCHNMQTFAKKFWNADKPRVDDEMFGTMFKIRDYVVNFCPFCGVKIS